jgi:hypothetical protein
MSPLVRRRDRLHGRGSRYVHRPFRRNGQHETLSVADFQVDFSDLLDTGHDLLVWRVRRQTSRTRQHA